MRLDRIGAHNLPDAITLFKELHELSDMRRFPFDESYTRAVTANLMHHPEWWGCLARSVDDTRYVGVLAGHICGLLFSQAKLGKQCAFYVRANVHFRGAIAMTLLRTFTQWCYTEHGCIMVESGDVASINGEAYHALHIRAGYRHYGTLYNHEPQGDV